KPVLFDCDPGIDDAFALAMAHASPDVVIEAVTTTFGNVGLDNTTNNALRLLGWIGCDAPVYRGVAGALLTETVDAASYHGASGLEAPGIPEPTRTAETTDAVSFLIAHLRAVDEPRTIIATGPLTNLAMAFRLAPDVIGKVERVVFMGGSTDYGNDSPAAEFNMMSDPHAAQIVLTSGVPCVMFGLNVTHQVIATPDRVEALRSIGNSAGHVFADMLDFFAAVYQDRYGFEGAALHDPCTVAWLVRPELFVTEPMRVDVETTPGLSYGRSVHDRWGIAEKAPNCDVALDADADGFFELLTELITTLT
ncbi:MAG TPA: nucleoside hydrolase, partial [Ilumatobacteraceae bacterium]|nr:nucleoside hydrolase [Ilumatobacteraceae bacterium]